MLSREFTLRVEEYLEAQRVIRFSLTRSALLRNATFIAIVLLLVGLALVSHGLFVWTSVFWLGAIGLLWIRFIHWRRSATRACKEDSALLGPFTATEGESALTVRSPQGTIDLPWEALRGAESPNLFVLATTAGKHVVLPKWAFSEGDLWNVQFRTRHLLNRSAGLVGRYSVYLVRGVQVVFVVVGLTLFAGDFDFIARIESIPFRSQPFSFLQRYMPKPSVAPGNQLRGEGPVFVVQIGEGASLLRDDVVQSYRQKYGLDIRVLSPLKIPDWARDPVRKQLIAEELVEAMRYAYSDVESSGVLIGVTSEDMYISSLWRDYAVNYRLENRFAVISTARLSQSVEGEIADDKVEKRFLKLLTKNLGLLYYKMDFSGNPYSLLAGNITAPDDLDKRLEDFSYDDVGSQGTPFFSDDDPCIGVHHHFSSNHAGPNRAFIFPCRSASRSLDVEVLTVDLRYGLFTDRRTEFSFPDTIPLEFSRVTRNLDDRSRALGVGGNHNLNIFPVGDIFPATWMDLLLEDGGRVHYKRANLGFGYWDALYRERSSGSEYSSSTVSWTWPGWEITTTSGREYLFPPALPEGPPEKYSLIEIREKDARLIIERNDKGHLLHAQSPSGAVLRFAYDDLGRIARIEASNGEWREYRYDSKGYLSQVISRDENTEYLREGRTLSIQYNGEPLLQSEFDNSGRMVGFRIPDGATYSFEYETDENGDIGGVTVSDSTGGLARFELRHRGYTVRYPKKRPSATSSESTGEWPSGMPARQLP